MRSERVRIPIRFVWRESLLREDATKAKLRHGGVAHHPFFLEFTSPQVYGSTLGGSHWMSFLMP
jgi:hypothetical protein